MEGWQGLLPLLRLLPLGAPVLPLLCLLPLMCLLLLFLLCPLPLRCLLPQPPALGCLLQDRHRCLHVGWPLLLLLLLLLLLPLLVRLQRHESSVQRGGPTVPPHQLPACLLTGQHHLMRLTAHAPAGLGL